MNCVILWWWKTQLTRKIVILHLDAPLRFVTFSLPSVLWLRFSLSSAPGLPSCPTTVHSPLSSQCGCPTIQMLLTKKSPDSWTWCVHVAQSHLHCTRPSLLLPHRSSSTDVSSGLQAFGCAAAIVRSGLHSSPHSAGLNAAFSGKPSLPSLFWMRAPPVLALGRHLAYFIALFHTLSSLPLYLPADLSKVWAPWMHVLCIH